MCPYLCEPGISSKVYLRAKLIRLHISPHSGLNQGPVPQPALKGWNIVFGHTNQFHLDHVLRPGYCDVVTFRLTIDQLDQIDHVLRPWYRDVWTKWGSCHLRNVPGKHSESPHRFPIEGDLIKKGSVPIIDIVPGGRAFENSVNYTECYQAANFLLLLYRWQGHCLSGSSDPSANWSHHHDPRNQVSFSSSSSSNFRIES